MAGSQIRIRLSPRSSRTEISRFEAGAWHVRVVAPPVDGAANEALMELLARAISVRKSSVRIKSGRSSRDKLVEIDGIGLETVTERLQAAVKQVT